MTVSKVIFHNQFENTVSPHGWSGTVVSANCSIGVDTHRPHHGARNLIAHFNANVGAGNWAALYYGSMANAYQHLFCRGMNVIWDQNPEDAGDMYRFFAFQQGTGGTGIAYYGVLNSAGTTYWFIRHRNGGAFQNNLGSVAVRNRLYCVECELLRSTVNVGIVRLWVNGVLNVEVSNLDHSRLLNYFDVGLGASAGPDLNALNVRMDCVTLSQMQIGCEKARRSVKGRGGDAGRRTNLFSTVRQGRRMGLHSLPWQKRFPKLNPMKV